MKFTATAVSIIALIGAAVAQQTSGDITVSTPASLVQCQPAAINWNGGEAPYIIAAIPGGQASAAALATISDAASGNTLTWTVNLPANTEITIKLTDAKGAIQYSSPVVIQKGSSDSCLTGGGASSASSASGSATSGTPSSASSAASGASSAASSAASAASSAVSSAASAATRTTATATAPTSTVTGSASGASTPASSGASGSSAPSSSASATGADSGALPNGMVAVPAVVFAALGAIFALF